MKRKNVSLERTDVLILTNFAFVCIGFKFYSYCFYRSSRLLSTREGRAAQVVIFGKVLAVCRRCAARCGRLLAVCRRCAASCEKLLAVCRKYAASCGILLAVCRRYAAGCGTVIAVINEKTVWLRLPEATVITSFTSVRE
jgi:hypothetical protein